MTGKVLDWNKSFSIFFNLHISLTIAQSHLTTAVCLVHGSTNCYMSSSETVEDCELWDTIRKTDPSLNCLLILEIQDGWCDSGWSAGRLSNSQRILFYKTDPIWMVVILEIQVLPNMHSFTRNAHAHYCLAPWTLAVVHAEATVTRKRSECCALLASGRDYDMRMHMHALCGGMGFRVFVSRKSLPLTDPKSMQQPSLTLI